MDKSILPNRNNTISGTAIEVAARSATRCAPACGPMAIAAWRIFRIGEVSGPNKLRLSLVILVLSEDGKRAIPLQMILIFGSNWATCS